MRPTDLNLGEQLKMTDREIRRRLELLQISEDDIADMLRLKQEIAPLVDSIVEEFYAMQVEEDEIAQLIGDAETLARLKKHMVRYILTLFDGEYGMEYVLSRLRIGLVHKRIGVPPKLYVPSLRNLFSILRRHLPGRDVESASCRRGLEALDKFMLFDLELVFDTYIHSLMEELAKGKREIEQYAESLEEIVAQRTAQLTELAARDGLTGLLNQRSFYEELRREVARTIRIKGRIALLYLDLDGFKKANDTFGHKRGDEILVGVAKLIRSVIRAEDIASRYGGDEFCIILPHSGTDEAEHVAQRLIESFAATMPDATVFLSIGIAMGDHEEICDGDTLVKMADKAMYKSKEIPGHAVTIANAPC